MSDDVPHVTIENSEDVVKHILEWIRANETEVKRLAAETGKFQKRTIGIASDPDQTTLLQVHIICEPRQFAKRTLDGEWSKLFQPK